MMRIATFSSIWGSSTGGIDVFNMDLVRSLSSATNVDVCACLQLRTKALTEDSKTYNFRFLTASDDLASPEVVEALGPWNQTQARAICALMKLKERFSPDYIILNDIFCKEVLISIREFMPDAKVVTLFHSAYGRSEKKKGKHDTELERKIQYQREMVAESDLAISVGSFAENYLRSISTEPLHSRIRSIIPGLPKFKSRARKVDHLNVISFGRLDPVSDTLKQIRVAATAWTSAVRSTKVSTLKTDDITFYAIGAKGNDSVLKDEKDKLNTWRTNILEIPFEDISDFDNSTLKMTMDRCAFALLNSWYENFGLTYLEACTFGIPTLMSESSGFYHELIEIIGHKDIGSLVSPIKVEDVTEGQLIEDIKLQIIASAQAYDATFEKASKIRELLLEKWPSWKVVANKFIKQLESIPAPVTGISNDRGAIVLQEGRSAKEFYNSTDLKWTETLGQLRDWCWQKNAPYYKAMKSAFDYQDRDRSPLTALQKSFWDSKMDLLNHPFRDLVLSGGTSSGKTTLAECLFGISRSHEFTRSRILYVAPTKALAQERAEDWKKKFPPPHNRDIEFAPVIVSTGDDNAADGALTRGDFNIAATVYEKANIILTAGQDLLSQLNLVIIDEFHMLGDLHRGSVVECLLAKIKIEKLRRLDSVNNDNPLRVVVITTEHSGSFINTFLSFDDDGTGDAVKPLVLTDTGRAREVLHSVILPGRVDSIKPAIFNIRKFGENDDLRLTNSEVENISKDLQLFQSRITLIKDGYGYDLRRQRLQYQIEFCKEWLHENPKGRRLLVFMSSKFDILEFARMLKNELSRKPIFDLAVSPHEVSVNKAGIDVFVDALDDVESTDFVQDIERCAQFGVFLHNSDVPRSIRSAFEKYLGFELPKNARSEFIIATETLSFGVNLQISDVALLSVLFPENERVPTGRPESILLSRCDFVNMSGRAGRLNQGGRDRAAQVFWYIDPPQEGSFESVARNFYGENLGVRSSLLYRSDARALEDLKRRRERAKLLDEEFGAAPVNPGGQMPLTQHQSFGDLAKGHPDRFSAVEKLSYPFTRSVLDCVRFLGGTATRVGSLGKPGCTEAEAISDFFFETLYHKQLLQGSDAEGSDNASHRDRELKRQIVLAQAVKQVMVSASLPQYQLMRRLTSGAFQITALGSASIDTGTEIRTVVNLRQALLALSGSWKSYFADELPFELAVLPAFFQPEVYRQYLARLPEFRLAMEWNPAANRDDLIGRISLRLRSQDIFSMEDEFKLRAALKDYLEWTIANQPIVSDPGRYEEAPYDACLRLFVGFLAWTSGSSLRNITKEIQSIYPSSGQKTESSVFNFEAFADNLTWKITFLVSLLRASEEQILPAGSAFDAVRFVHRSRFGCIEQAVPLLFRNKSTVPPLNRVEAHSIIEKKYTAATIALGQLDGMTDFGAKKERLIRNHVRKFIAESYHELSRQFSYLASGTGVGKLNEDLSKEYWSFSARQIDALLTSANPIDFSWSENVKISENSLPEMLFQEHEGSQFLIGASARGLSLTTFQPGFEKDGSDKISLVKSREIRVQFAFGSHLDTDVTSSASDQRGILVDFPWSMGIEDTIGDDVRLSPAAFGILLSLCSREFVADVDRYLAAVMSYIGSRCIGSRELYVMSEPHLKKGGFPEGLFEAWAKYIEVAEA